MYMNDGNKHVTSDQQQYPNYTFLKYKVQLLSYIFSQVQNHLRASVVFSVNL